MQIQISPDSKSRNENETYVLCTLDISEMYRYNNNDFMNA